MFDLRAQTPTARLLPLHGPLKLPAPLSEVMPLKSLLAPVTAFKENMAAALEGLLSDCQVGKRAYESPKEHTSLHHSLLICSLGEGWRTLEGGSTEGTGRHFKKHT